MSGEGTGRHSWNFNDLTGQQFGRWTVLCLHSKSNGQVKWLCRCSCALKTERPVTGPSLINGDSKSCGCWNRESSAAHHTTHGMRDSTLYSIWTNMLTRCRNAETPAYQKYGAKGITVCEEWLDFEVFMKWALANGYEEGLTIDRYPNQKGGYCSTNCRWATWKQQARNRESNRFFEFNDRSLTAPEWDEVAGLPEGTVYQRIMRGWSIEKALTPLSNKGNLIMELDGQRKSVKEFAEEMGIDREILMSRKRKGWSDARTLTEPLRQTIDGCNVFVSLRTGKVLLEGIGKKQYRKKARG